MYKLYIIGNGFDLHHDLPTSYKGFCNYLEVHNVTLCDTLNNTLSYPKSDEDIWCRFEENLSFIDLEYLEDIVRDFIPSLSSDDYLKDMSACHREAETIIFNLTEGLRNEFANYIQLASTCNIDSNRLLNIDKNAFYLSFNYTKTLERHYGIDEDNILYIHGRYDDKENIVLGHAISPDSFIKEQENKNPPDNLTAEELKEWYEYMSDQYIPFLDEAKEELASYYVRSFKNSEEIIENNSEFFASLNFVSSIFVLGHSMSSVDFEYFKAIRAQVPVNCQWTVTYYDESEKENLEDTLLGLEIPSTNYNLIKLTSMKVKQ